MSTETNIQEMTEELNVVDPLSMNQYELLFCTSLRRRLFKKEQMSEQLVNFFKEVEKEQESDLGYKPFKILDVTVNPNNAHLILNCSPKYGVHEAAVKLKYGTAKKLNEYDPTLKTRLPSIWKREYLCHSIGDRLPIEMLEDYLAQIK